MRMEIELDGVLDPRIVKERFDTALRDGNPFWVWPDTNRDNWRSALSTIAKVTREILTCSGQVLEMVGHPKDLSVACFTSGMGPLLGYWLREGKLTASTETASMLELHLEHNHARANCLSRETEAIVDQMQAASVPVTLLKGIHTAHNYFPHPGTRPMSDVDIWVEEDALGKARRILETLGYAPGEYSHGEQVWRRPVSPSLPRNLYFLHRDDPWSVDLHTSLDRRYSPGSKLIRLDEMFRAKERETWSGSASGRCLAGAALVYHLAFHASQNPMSLTLLRLTELVMVIRQLDQSRTVCWEEFADIGQRNGVPGFIYPAFHLVNKLVPDTVPQDVIRTIEAATPANVRTIASALNPATCHRVVRCSMRERFMWTSGAFGWVREIFGSMWPNAPINRIFHTYRMRIWRIVKGTIQT